MKHLTLFLGLVVALLLVIIPIALFSVYLYDSKPSYQSNLLFQRDFSQFEAYSYTRLEESCQSLSNPNAVVTPLSCTKKTTKFTIYSGEKSGDRYRYYLQFESFLSYLSQSGGAYSLIANETLTDIISFYLDSNFQFYSIIYSNLTNDTLVDLSRTIIYHFSPNLLSTSYGSSLFGSESIGDMNVLSKRNMTDNGTCYILNSQIQQNQGTNFLGTNSYYEVAVIDKATGTINDTTATQTMIMPINFNIQSNVSSMSLQMNVTTVTNTYLTTQASNENQVSTIKYSFLMCRSKILEYSLFNSNSSSKTISSQTSNTSTSRRILVTDNSSNSSNTTNSNTTTNITTTIIKNNTNTTIIDETNTTNTVNSTTTSTQPNSNIQVIPLLGNLEIYGIKFSWHLNVQKIGQNVQVDVVLNAERDTNDVFSSDYTVFTYTYLDEGKKSPINQFIKLLVKFYGADFLKLVLQNKAGFTQTPNVYKLPRMPFMALPSNPLGITGNIYLELSFAPVIKYMLNRVAFFYNLNQETDFTQLIYQNTKFYNLDATKNQAEIQALLNGAKSDIYTVSQRTQNNIEIAYVFTATVGLDVALTDTAKLDMKITGNMFTGKLELSFDINFFNSVSFISASLFFTIGSFNFTANLFVTSPLEKNIVLMNDIIVADPSKNISVPQTAVILDMINYDENDTNSSQIPENNCPLSADIARDALCFTEHPCGCTLYPNVASTDENDYIEYKKGITDACETEDPLINLDYFNQYRIKQTNCLNPFQQIDQTSCKPVADWFYIGEGFPLNASVKNLSNYADVKSLDDDFFTGATIQTAIKAKSDVLSINSLSYYNNLTLLSNNIYRDYYNNRTHFEDIMSQANETNNFSNLPRSIRTAFFLFMDNFEEKHGENDEVLMALLRDFYTQDYKSIVDFCSSSDNNSTCSQNNLNPIITLLKFSCNKCNYKDSKMKARLIFLMDGSGSIIKDDFNKERQFINNLLAVLNNNSNLDYQAAAIQYSTTVTLVSNFSNNLTTLQKAITATDKIDGYTKISLGFSKAAELFRDISSFDGFRFIIIITDGQATSDFMTELNDLRNVSSIIFTAIGIGKDINITELNVYTNSSDNVYMLSSFNSLSFMQDMLGQEMCYGIEEVKDVDFAKNKSIIGTSQEFYKLTYEEENGKTIQFTLNITATNGSIFIYASLTTNYPNNIIHDYQAMFINGTYYLFIPKRKHKHRLLQNLTTTTTTTSPFYLSMVYNSPTASSLSISTSNNITVNMSCSANCASCDETGQICYQCTSQYALISGLCASLNITESVLVVTSPSDNTVKVQNGTQHDVNQGNLAGLVIFAIIEFFIFIAVIIVGIKYFKNLKKKGGKNEKIPKKQRDIEAHDIHNMPSPTEVPLKQIPRDDSPQKLNQPEH